LRVAFFHDTARIGGAERYLVDLCRAAAESGIDVHLLTPDGVLPEFARVELGTSVSLRVLPARPAFSDSLAANLVRTVVPTWRLSRVLRAIRPHVFHINNGGFPGSHLARSAVFSSDVPVVMTVHAVPQLRRTKVRLAHGALDKLVWRRLDAVVSGTDRTAVELSRRRGAPPALVHVIPYGVDRPQPGADAVEQVRRKLAPNGELLVGMVVAPSSEPEVIYKGHAVLLDALATVPRARGVLIGHDPAAELAARPALAQRVASLGHVDDVSRFMAAFDVLVVPSTRDESLPLVVLEAMAAGTPVVASRLAGLPEAIGEDEAGILFEPGDAGALASVLRRFDTDRELVSQVGSASRRRFDARYSLERMTQRTIDLYHEVNSARSDAEREG
jgi:glycogen synthase